MKIMNIRQISHLTSFLKIPHRQTSKVAVKINEDVHRKLESEELKPRFHPGICKSGNIVVPPRLVQAISRSLKDHPIKALLTSAKALNQYLSSRHPPPEPTEVKKNIKEIQKEVDEKFKPPGDLETLPENEIRRYESNRNRKIETILKQRTFAWKPISFKTDYEVLVYAIGRFSKEYTTLVKIFMEIAHRDPNFKPRSFFDFGAGTGTGMWAACRIWNDSIFEFLNIDSSREMNDLSDLILRDGNENQQTVLKNVFYRQFLPASDTKYDFLLSAFSLFELSSKQNRKEVLLNMWKKCDGYLVIVEEGSFAGYRLINEARDFLLSLGDGEVFAPCPHDSKCPRMDNAASKLPCNFQLFYKPLEIGERMAENKVFRYTYLVMKKGISSTAAEERWPRIVQPTLIRSNHTICRMCSPKGNIQEIIFTKAKHGKFAYRCAKASDWGDRLPIEIGDKIITEKSLPKEKLSVKEIPKEPSPVVK